MSIVSAEDTFLIEKYVYYCTLIVHRFMEHFSNIIAAEVKLNFRQLKLIGVSVCKCSIRSHS